MRMDATFTARKHPVLTTPRDTKAQVIPIGEMALSIPTIPVRKEGVVDDT